MILGEWWTDINNGPAQPTAGSLSLGCSSERGVGLGSEELSIVGHCRVQLDKLDSQYGAVGANVKERLSQFWASTASMVIWNRPSQTSKDKNGWKWLEMDENGWKWMQMVG